MPKRLGARFFRRPADQLARSLLGKILCHHDKAAMIVETEAYFGPEDAASHARFGKTARNAVMFGPAGIAYVYLCYGVHEMFNIVSGDEQRAGAVLIRGCAPVQNLGADVTVARGPGKLTRALGIDREHNGANLATDPALYVTSGRAIAKEQISVGPRIGVDYAGEWAAAPYRYWITNHAAVSAGNRANEGKNRKSAASRRARISPR